jgi:predicted kinase
MSDVAFLFMDLAAHRRRDLAHAFLSRYLEESGDYGGLRLLPLYAVYRALVRAKIDALAARSVAAERAQALRAREAERIGVAKEFMSERQPALLLTHGLTASGKSWLSERLVPTIHAVRVRADLERKRLARLEPLESSHSGVGENLYAAAVTERVYERLRDCADAALSAGFNALVDASFLRAAQRERFRQLAVQRRVPYLILSCHADAATLDARLDARRARVSARNPAALECGGARTGVGDRHQLDHGRGGRRRSRQVAPSSEIGLGGTDAAGTDPSRLPSGLLNLDLYGHGLFGLGLLRQVNVQHPVFGLGADRLLLHVLRQRETALRRAAPRPRGSRRQC